MDPSTPPFTEGHVMAPRTQPFTEVFSIALKTKTVDRHSSIQHEMQNNENWHKWPILTIYRLTNLRTDSPNTHTSFTWLQAHNHSLTFTLRHLTSGPATSVGLRVPVTELSACVPLTTSVISWPQKRKSMFFHIYIYIKTLYQNTRVFACNVVSKLQRHRWTTFGDLRAHTHKRTNGQLFLYI
jgi:hypothetical protein